LKKADVSKVCISFPPPRSMQCHSRVWDPSSFSLQILAIIRLACLSAQFLT
jgi:hypothetical protein